MGERERESKQAKGMNKVNEKVQEEIEEEKGWMEGEGERRHQQDAFKCYITTLLKIVIIIKKINKKLDFPKARIVHSLLLKKEIYIFFSP